MVPVKPAASGLPAVGRPAVAAAAVPAPMPTAAAAAAPRPVACRKCRRVTPGTAGRPGCHGDPVVSCPCSRELLILVILSGQVGALLVETALTSGRTCVYKSLCNVSC